MSSVKSAEAYYVGCTWQWIKHKKCALFQTSHYKKIFIFIFIETPSQFSLQSMWKLVVAQMCHLKAAHQKWDRTDVSSVKLSEAYSAM